MYSTSSCIREISRSIVTFFFHAVLISFLFGMCWVLCTMLWWGWKMIATLEKLHICSSIFQYTCWKKLQRIHKYARHVVVVEINHFHYNNMYFFKFPYFMEDVLLAICIVLVPYKTLRAKLHAQRRIHSYMVMYGKSKKGWCVGAQCAPRAVEASVRPMARQRFWK